MKYTYNVFDVSTRDLVETIECEHVSFMGGNTMIAFSVWKNASTNYIAFYPTAHFYVRMVENG